MMVNGNDGGYLVVAIQDGGMISRHVVHEADEAEDIAQFLSEDDGLGVVIEVRNGYDARIAKVFRDGQEDPPQTRDS